MYHCQKLMALKIKYRKRFLCAAFCTKHNALSSPSTSRTHLTHILPAQTITFAMYVRPRIAWFYSHFANAIYCVQLVIVRVTLGHLHSGIIYRISNLDDSMLCDEWNRLFHCVIITSHVSGSHKRNIIIILVRLLLEE